MSAPKIGPVTWSVPALQEIVCRYYAVDRIEMLSGRGSADVLEAARVAMWLVRRHREMTYQDIANVFARVSANHAMIACQNVERRMASDGAFAADIAAMLHIVEG